MLLSLYVYFSVQKDGGGPAAGFYPFKRRFAALFFLKKRAALIKAAEFCLIFQDFLYIDFLSGALCGRRRAVYVFFASSITLAEWKVHSKMDSAF